MVLWLWCFMLLVSGERTSVCEYWCRHCLFLTSQQPLIWRGGNKRSNMSLSMTAIENDIESISSKKESATTTKNWTHIMSWSFADESRSILKQELPIQAKDAMSSITTNTCSWKNISPRCCLEMREDTVTVEVSTITTTKCNTMDQWILLISPTRRAC